MGKESKDLFFELSIDMLCIADDQGYFTQLNPRWEFELGFSNEELMAKPFIEFVHPDDREKTIGEASKLYEENSKHQTVNFQNRYLTKSGDYIWLQWASQARDGVIYAVARNISKEKEASIYLEAMGEIANTGYWRLDFRKMQPFWSDKTYDIHGVDRGTQPPLEDAINFYAPEYRADVQAFVEHATTTGEGWDRELQIITAQGNRKWVRTWGKPEYLNGELIGMYGVFQDIDSQKANELKIQKAYEETKKYKAALDNQAIVAFTDAKGVITYVNQKFVEISGYSREELVGQTHGLVNSGFHPPSFFKEMWQTIQSGQQWQGLIRNRKKDGTYYWVESKITPMKNSKGEIVEYLAIRNDVTDQVLLKEQVNSQQEQLVRSSRLVALGEMAGGVAHEINNPLAVLRVGLMALKKLVDDPEAKANDVQKQLSQLDETVTRISKVVTGLRSFARDDSGVEYSNASPEAILQDTLALCSEKFTNHGVELTVNTETTPLIECNSTQISQVLLNLLSNAYQAVEDQKKPGRIDVHLRMQGNGRVEFVVSDNGPGVSEDLKAKVFEPFFTTKPVGSGTGLGLGISLGICKAHGGVLTVEPSSFGGAEFRVVLPVRQENAKKGQAA